MEDVQLVAYPLTDKGRNVQMQITKWKLCFTSCRDLNLFSSAWF